jgi:DNA-binding response OmpR family regulator
MGKRALVINSTMTPAASFQLLTREGYDVDVVPNAEEGLQYLDDQVYDVIIIKISPKAESWLLCEEIRRLSRLPLILISINASTDTCVRSINAGADYFLRKPFGPMEFITRVQSLLERRSPKPATPVGA